MAGQLSVSAIKSLPVSNRSGRLFTAAGIGASVIALSQWAHWAGYADWDLLSLIPGFTEATGLMTNAHADGSNFDCPNKTLGAEVALMSDDMLKSVGKALCTKEEMVLAALRGTDGATRARRLAAIQALDLQGPVVHLPLMRPPAMIAQPVSSPLPNSFTPKTFTMASLQPVKVETNRDLLEDINRRARRLDAIDPCAGGMATRSSAGCEVEHPPVDDPHSGGGGGGSDGGDHSGGSDYDGHSGSGNEGTDGDKDYTDNGDGEDHDGDSSHGGSGEDSGSNHDGSSHDGSGDVADNEGSHGGNEGGGSYAHDGDSGGAHDSVDTAQEDHSASYEQDTSHDSVAETDHGGSVQEVDHSGGDSGDDSSHESGSDGGGHDSSSDGGGSGSSGSDGGGQSGGHG